jgi:uncharacterized delta-60 repeat protein
MRRLILMAAVLTAALGVPAGSALAAPGDLDTTFGGGDGWVLTDLGGEDIALDVAVDSAGRIVLVGDRETSAGNSEAAVLRYTTAGEPDPTFGGGDGIVLFRFGTGTHDSAPAVAIDGSNRIVVAGNYGEPPCPSFCNTGVVRLTESGQLDPTFSGDGKASAPYALVGDVALDAAGRIVVGGEFATFRFTDAGLPDSTFSGDGATTEGAGAWGMAFDGAGRIVTVSESAAVSRLLPDGELDPSFGDEGEPIGIDIEPGSTDSADGMAVDAANRVLVAGVSDPAGGGESRSFVVRLTEAPTFDSTFAGDGIMLGAPGSRASGIAVDEAGRLLILESLNTLRRYLPDGFPDPAFGGGDGSVDLPFDGGGEVTTDPTGRIAVGGRTFRPDEADLDFAAARFLDTGTPASPPPLPPAQSPPAPPETSPSVVSLELGTQPGCGEARRRIASLSSRLRHAASHRQRNRLRSKMRHARITVAHLC